LNHDADARNSDLGKQLIGYTWEPQPIPGEDADLYRFCKSAIVDYQWQAILRSGNVRRHGFLTVLPGRSHIDHVVPRIAVVSQDTKEQVLTAGVLSSYCVRCETFVKPRYRYDKDSAAEADPNLPRSLSTLDSRPVFSPNGVTFWVCLFVDHTRIRRQRVTATGNDPFRGLSGVDLERAIKHTKATKLYNRRLDKGLTRCMEDRDPTVRTALRTEYGTSPLNATSEAIKAFKSHGLVPFSAGIFDSPEFSLLMGHLCLAKHMAMEEFHVVRLRILIFRS
jgi:hypothetical protein